VKEKKTSEAECATSTGHRVWKIIGGVALVLVATGIITQFRDIRRYINMMRM
jgi:hypothetical protein